MRTITVRGLKVLRNVSALTKELTSRNIRPCGAWQVAKHGGILVVDATAELLTRYREGVDIPIFEFYRWSKNDKQWRKVESGTFRHFKPGALEQVLQGVLENGMNLNGQLNNLPHLGFRVFDLQPIAQHLCDECSGNPSA